jgi:branched-chain amino acid transport system permease protein
MKSPDRRQVAGAVLLALLLASPLVLHNAAYTLFLTSVLLWGMFALSFDVAFGLAGMMSFGHAAFFGVGAYSVAMLGQHTTWPFAVLLLCAVGIGFVHGCVVGAIGMRSAGVYFGLFTLGMAELVNVLFSTRLRALTGGADGLTGLRQPRWESARVPPDLAYYLITALLFLALLAAFRMLRKSAFGRVLDAARMNEVRALQLGFDVARMRVLAFGLSAAGSALAGALLATKMMYVSPQLLHWGVSGDVLMVAVIGGSGTLLGPLAGALVVEGLRHLLSEQTIYWNGLLGLVFVFVTLFMPQGIVGQYLRWRDARRPASAAVSSAAPASLAQGGAA